MAAKAIRAFNASAFNIEMFLRRYFASPSAFRAMQDRTGTIIAGSTALSFFDRSIHKEDNVNLYVNPGHNYEVARHLVDFQGYTFQPATNRGHDLAQTFEQLDNIERRECVYSVITIDGAHRFTRSLDSGQTIEVLLMSTARSPMHALLSAHSSA